MTGQETSSTDKPLRKDLYRRVRSGDLVAARLVTFLKETLRDERDHEVPRHYGSHLRFDNATVARYPVQGKVRQCRAFHSLQVYRGTF